ncbi:DUF6270 domain-containing protein [Brachybacterium sp. AOP42-C2-15]|uniref:DUF6270 domain-containing protein n=1 Tax=Brachybacterium sp. AOP42-C2-15 TaxID=3457670 RepID=UPI004034A6A0
MPLTIDGGAVPAQKGLSLFVYGSCVSRDLIEIPSVDATCIDYVARQSWISAAAPTGIADVEFGLGSAFQRRMLAGDLAGDALEQLRQGAGKAGAILLDIVDDRFGVYPCGAGFLTPTAEFHAAGLRNMLELGEHIPFGTSEHLELWTAAARTIWSALGEYRHKAFLLGANFTARSIDGAEVPQALGRGADEWNRLYRPYYERARDIGFQTLMLPDSLAVTTPHHRWNAAPFHYVEFSYGWWYETILRSLDRQSSH